MSRDATTEVRTRSGRVRGLAADGVHVFRGIPYARPPVGKHRFAAPHPADAWDGVRDATAFGPPPPQSALGGREDAPSGGWANPYDWLTINVWTPDPAAAGVPVMVYLYGGAFMIGHGGQPEYDGSILARSGVVLVTFNYRVGFEGFAQLTDAPANRGLLDQVAALAWVRDNIAAFGGDPGRVTVFGESAGAASVAALLAMPRADGLFRHAAAQSLPGLFAAPGLAADIAAAITDGLGLRPCAADLADVPPGRLRDAGDTLAGKLPHFADRWGLAARAITPYFAVVDGDVLPESPWAAVAAGRARDVPLLVGHNRDEYRLITVFSGLHGNVTDADAESALEALAPGRATAYRSAFPGADAGFFHESVYPTGFTACRPSAWRRRRLSREAPRTPTNSLGPHRVWAARLERVTAWTSPWSSAI
ncbi:carboxylesterase/lipase family protein [Yinghuangia aomiensis]